MTAGALNPLGEDRNRTIRIWLLFIVALIFIMVIVGGATRLTNSGLSITEWQPLLGAIPPFTPEHWADAFRKYQAIPEYRLENHGMTLEEFKFIYWWEWSHRFLGRFIGIAFLIPMLWFWFSGRLDFGLRLKLVILFLLGGLQGALGWFMVKSGLVDRVDVSQYRLAAHLGLAVFLMIAVFWVYLGLQEPRGKKIGDLPASVRLSGTGLFILLFIQVLLGALVAGIHAGRSYNTWPLMDGRFIPEGLGSKSPWYINLFENPVTVQFDHRMVAYLVFIWIIWQVYLVAIRLGEGRHLRSAALLLLAIVAQIALGIWTLLEVVPLSLGLLHQAGALVVLLVALTHLHSLYHPRTIERGS